MIRGDTESVSAFEFIILPYDYHVNRYHTIYNISNIDALIGEISPDFPWRSGGTKHGSRGEGLLYPGILRDGGTGNLRWGWPLT